MEFLASLSERAATWSLVGQIGSMIVAWVIGRLVLKSRLAILLVSLAGAAGAMASLIMVDGQGACVYVLAAPMIYLFAVAGRDDLDRKSGR